MRKIKVQLDVRDELFKKEKGVVTFLGEMNL
jgi:hypothetical protein